MNRGFSSGTPRLRGRFPQTPDAHSRVANGDAGSPPRPAPVPAPAGSLAAAAKDRPPLKFSEPETTSASSSLAAAAATLTAARRPAQLPIAPINNLPSQNSPPPVIPLTVLDAPTQRLYAAGAYVILVSWRLVDWMRLGEDFDSSWLLFLKWVVIDLVFLFGLPELRIPWLELSQSAVLGLFAAHAFMTYLLMFNIGMPLLTLVSAVGKVIYDREMALMEHTVKLSSILHNQSLIMGKQIINILPEGTATLNPGAYPFCLDKKDRKEAFIPIHFNSTIPKEIQLVRIDIDTGAEETLWVGKSDLKRIQKQIQEETQDGDVIPAAITWDFKVKKPGVYRLKKVLDKYKLEVQRRTRDTFVVPCPRALVKATPSTDRCVRDLSDLSLEVVGTPPLKIHYSRTINGKDHSFHFQSLQPDSLPLPLLPVLGGGKHVVREFDDVSWIRPATVSVPLNESMNTPGEWRYAIAEVHDSLGNMVNYTIGEEELDAVPAPGLEQRFRVKERPQVYLQDCNPRDPLKVAKGHRAKLPLKVDVGSDALDRSYKVTWDFSPADTLSPTGDHGEVVVPGSYSGKDTRFWPDIMDPGLYTVRSISSNGCDGEIREPSSCLLYNPPEPELSLHAENIPDRCAGNSIGLSVDLHLVGTPPFSVRYDVMVNGGEPRRERLDVRGLRYQLSLVPRQAGHHKYVFKQIDDDIYKGVPLLGSEMVLEQNVKPAAQAIFQTPSPVITSCLEDEVEVDVLLIGDAPFTLEWDMFHEGKRKTERVTGLMQDTFKIKTSPLTKGGDYVLSLGSIQDKAGCRNSLDEQVKISVRRQKPRAAFGLVEGRRSAVGVEGESFRMPLRLQGEEHWTVSYRNLARPATILKHHSRNGNDVLLTSEPGTWEIVAVEDDMCPGVVDAKASTFETSWYPKPAISIVESKSIIAGPSGVYEKVEICEGDADTFEVSLSGTPPFLIEYQTNHKPFSGPKAVKQSRLDAPLSKASVPVDSSKPGDFTYVFSDPSDSLYNSDKRSKALVVWQRINARPSAAFVKPGQSFKYCQLEQPNEETIPISLVGVAPFAIDVEIKHHGGGSGSPSRYHIPSIPSSSYDLRIPREHLSLGTQQVRIRRVRDSRGCQQRFDGPATPSVQVNVYEAPSIFPLEPRTDYCVGERIAYTLTGSPPFNIMYDFDGERRARVPSTDFRRVAESPGVFTITHVSDSASECRAPVNISRTIHPLPSVRISRGQLSRVDIHEGGEVPILFEFGGTPPFEFTYTRSTNARKGQRSTVLETRHEMSYEYSMIIPSSQEGTYEVVAIKDKYCSYSLPGGSEQRKLKAP